jgi:RNA polymerase sigma factor (sigma-70 family)
VTYYAYSAEKMGPYRVDPMKHYGLAVNIARRFRCPHLTQDDLIQEALAALCAAARTYDPENARHAKFTTWAGTLINHHLFGVVNHYRRIGSMGNRNHYAPRNLRRHLWRDGSTHPDDIRKVLSNRWGGPNPSDWECFVAVTMWSHIEQSLDEPVGDIYRNSPSALIPLVEMVEDEEILERMDEELRAEDYQKLIAEALEKMTPKERDVAVRRVLKMLDDPPTLEEIGQDWGVTRERVRQIESRARNVLIKKLGREMRP